MRVVSFFAGCGGLDLGFKQAGFNIIWANELDAKCKETYSYNHPETNLVIGDICTVPPNLIPDCDGFIGGPPCQSWSVGGNQRGLEDDRGKLFLKYIELIRCKQPNFFVIENVKGILDDKFKNVLNFFLDSLREVGYDVTCTLIDAVEYRVPQNRMRVFLIGFKSNLEISYNFPGIKSNKLLTLADAIGDLPEKPNLWFNNKSPIKYTDFPNHDVLMSDFGPFYYRGNRRRSWNQPSFTINATAGFTPLHPSSPPMLYRGRCNWRFNECQLENYRRLSVRECARIQTFPDDFIFKYDNIMSGYKMVGNAVPPRLAYEIALSIKSVFLNYGKIRPFKSVPSEETVLVGYYKNEYHRSLIQRNKLYYIRADNRRGSLSKENFILYPSYLLLHHKNNYFLYEMAETECFISSGKYLASLGFKPQGESYLCFKLKTGNPSMTSPFNNGTIKVLLDSKSSIPEIIPLGKLIKPVYE